MLKKVKDLTKKEMKDICKKHRHCDECPLALSIAYYNIVCLKNKNVKEKLEKEIEVMNNE